MGTCKYTVQTLDALHYQYIRTQDIKLVIEESPSGVVVAHFQKQQQSKPLRHKYRMVRGNVIDLTGEDAQEQAVIDLTSASNSPAPRSKPSLTNGKEEEDGSQSKGARSQRKGKKPKKLDAHGQVSVEKDAPGSKSLLQRIQPQSSDTNHASTLASKSLSKRKRRESVDSTAQTHVEARPPPPKRHKSQALPPIPAVDESSSTNDSNKKKKPKNKSGQGSVDRQALPISPLEQATASKGASNFSKKPPSSRGKKQNRSSQSPMPSTTKDQVTKKRKSTPRARSASVSNTPTSPALSTSALFYVDTAPNAENKHIEDVPVSAFRIEEGNLLLPQHVLLESVDEALHTPGNEVYPPPTPGLSEGSIDVVDDSLRNVRRYWEPEVGQADMEECRTCGQFHTSKLCIGTSVCFTCGSTAHQARRCPFKISCYRCGVAGHVQADCPVAREDLKSSRDCYLCGSTSHGTHNCARNWRIYKYRDAHAREKDIDERIAMKPLILARDESVGEENYVGVEPWCYNCGSMGHLGDDCLRETMDDRPREASAFGLSNVLYGPFAPRYRRVADDIYKQMEPNSYIVFGDQLLDESSLALEQQQPPQYRYDIPLPADLPLKPGKSGRQRERERLGRERRGAEENDEDDWFSNQQRRPAPPPRSDARDRRDSHRDRRREYDRSRGHSDDRGRNPKHDRRATGKLLYSTKGGGSSGYDRPPERSMSPPPMPPPSTMYPSSMDMAAGYHTNDHYSSSRQSTGSTGLSIRGAASRPRGDGYAHESGSSRGYGDSGKDRDYDGRSNGCHDRDYRRDDRGPSGGGGGGYRNGRDRDRYDDTRRRHNDRY